MLNIVQCNHCHVIRVGSNSNYLKMVTSFCTVTSLFCCIKVIQKTHIHFLFKLSFVGVCSVLLVVFLYKSRILLQYIYPNKSSARPFESRAALSDIDRNSPGLVCTRNVSTNGAHDAILMMTLPSASFKITFIITFIIH